MAQSLSVLPMVNKAYAKCVGHKSRRMKAGDVQLFSAHQRRNPDKSVHK